MPRHIALLMNDLESGGAQRVASLLGNAWVARGDKVSLISYDGPGEKPFYDFDPRIALYPLDLKTPSSHLFKALHYNALRVVAVRRFLLKLKPDVLLCFGAEITPTGALAGLGLDVKVYACDRSDPSIYPPPGIWRRLRDATYRMVRGVVVQTPRAAEFCRQFNKNIIVIPNPVEKPDVTKLSGLNVPEGKFIASLGRLGFEKG